MYDDDWLGRKDSKHENYNARNERREKEKKPEQETRGDAEDRPK